MSGVYRCGICGYQPDELGASRKKRALGKHIRYHGRADLWNFVIEHSTPAGTERGGDDEL